MSIQSVTRAAGMPGLLVLASLAIPPATKAADKESCDYIIAQIEAKNVSGVASTAMMYYSSAVDYANSTQAALNAAQGLTQQQRQWCQSKINDANSLLNSACLGMTQAGVSHGEGDDYYNMGISSYGLSWEDCESFLMDAYLSYGAAVLRYEVAQSLADQADYKLMEAMQVIDP
jgi:hypothetical protein